MKEEILFKNTNTHIHSRPNSMSGSTDLGYKDSYNTDIYINCSAV